MIRRMLLAAVSAALGEVPQNSHAWTYTIWGFDKSPYITRTLLPRLGKRRLLLHRIHREDYDQWMHNHPWSNASFLIVSGGYTEERLVDGEVGVAALAVRPGASAHGAIRPERRSGEPSTHHEDRARDGDALHAGRRREAARLRDDASLCDTRAEWEEAMNDWYMPHVPMDAVSREEERRRQAAQAAFIESLKRTTWEWTLVHNLAIAGALCRAFELGKGVPLGPGRQFRRGPHVLVCIPDPDWVPGCGRSAP